MSSTSPQHPASAARADAVEQVLRLPGVAAVFPPTLAVVRSLATRTSDPRDALRLSAGPGPAEARLDIAVAAGHRPTDVGAAVQELLHRVLAGHGIEVSSVTIAVLEHGGRDADAAGDPESHRVGS